jgi:hypothetical protein
MPSHDAAPIAPQDLRSAFPLRQGARTAPRAGISRLVARVLRAWMTGWTWYVRQGLGAPSVEPVFPMRPRVGARARRTLPPALARWVMPSAPLPVAALYDCAAGAGCA